NLGISLKLDDKKNFSLGVDYIFSDFNVGPLKLKNSSGSLLYSDSSVIFHFFQGDANLNEVNKKVDISGKLKDNQMKINYKVDKFLGKADLLFSDENLKISSEKGIFEGHAQYDYKSKKISLIEKESKIDNRIESLIIYDVKKNNLDVFQGEWNIDFLGMGALKLIGVGENNELYFNEIKVIQDDKVVASGEGEIDLNKSYYNLRYESENLKYSHPIAGEVLDIKINSVGELSGTGKKFRFDSEGTIETLNYREYSVNGLRYSLKLDKNNLQILNVSNNILTISGNYNIIQKELSLNYEMNNLQSDYLQIKEMEFNIVKARGFLKKNEKGIQSELEVIDSKIRPFGDKDFKVQGKIAYDNGIFILKDGVLNENSKVSGNYEIKSKKYSLFANVFETNLSQYIQDKNFKYRIIGQFSANGIGKSVDAKGDFSVDEIFFKGEKIGKLRGRIAYNGKNFLKGLLKVENLDFIRTKESLLTLKGDIDFDSEVINLNLNEDNIFVESLYEKSPLKGKFSLQSEITGNLKMPKYNLKLNSSKISVENFDFDNINFSAKGDLKNISIDNFSFNYLENKMKVAGHYNIKDSEYLLKLNSEEINLKFLNLLLKKSPLKEIEGEARINLSLSNLENSGIFKGETISFMMDDSRIRAKDINFDISLKEKKID
ncbi:MAG: hypothetical protein ACRCZ9_10660, partial [Fusobacteriaceae bacterium]